VLPDDTTNGSSGQPGADVAGSGIGTGNPDAGGTLPRTGPTNPLLLLVVGLVLVFSGALLIYGRRWQPLDGSRDTVI